jgi:hypothetical protein
MGLYSIYQNEMIFGTTLDRALTKLNEIRYQIINSEDETIEKESRDSIKTNKRTIKAVWFSQNCRGYRCSEVYVDSDLRIKDLFDLIIPIMNTGYYGEEKKSVHERIHYFN